MHDEREGGRAGPGDEEPWLAHPLTPSPSRPITTSPPLQDGFCNLLGDVNVWPLT